MHVFLSRRQTRFRNFLKANLQRGYVWYINSLWLTGGLSSWWGKEELRTFLTPHILILWGLRKGNPFRIVGRPGWGAPMPSRPNTKRETMQVDTTLLQQQEENSFSPIFPLPHKGPPNERQSQLREWKITILRIPPPHFSPLLCKECISPCFADLPMILL